jgi:hypothetical protein
LLVRQGLQHGVACFGPDVLAVDADDANAADQMAQRARAVDTAAAQRGDAVDQHALAVAAHHRQRQAALEVFPRDDLVAAGVDEELRPALQLAVIQAGGVGSVQLVELEAQVQTIDHERT